MYALKQIAYKLDHRMQYITILIDKTTSD